MRAVVQRVSRARVIVDGEVVGALDGPGLVVLLGVTHADGPEQVAWMARKVAELRILREERSAVDMAAPVKRAVAGMTPAQIAELRTVLATALAPFRTGTGEQLSILTTPLCASGRK